MVKLILAPAFQKITGGQKTIEVEGETLLEAIDQLESNFPGVKNKIIGDSGQILNYVSIFIGKEDAKYLEGLKTLFYQIRFNIKRSVVRIHVTF